MDRDMRDIMICVEGVRKKYRLGEITADTLQEELKIRRDIRRGRLAVPDMPGHLENGYLYALNGVDLTVYKGEALGIVGRNGAGKSTLLKLLSRITEPTEGRIRLYGRVASMLEVGTGFHGDMTGRENIYLNGAILGMSKKEIDRKMEDIIKFSEVRDFIDTPVKRYSSGMYVKLGFAVAAHLDSEIMIMDEVLAVGDMQFQHKCLDRMREAARQEGRTVLYVSHNMNTIQRLCSRCIVLDEGKIIYDGDVDKAITIYLGTDGSGELSYTYTQDYRPYDRQLRRNLRFNMDGLKVLSSTSDFQKGDRPELRLAYTAYRDLPRTGFRLELWSQNGVKVGTMLSGNFVDISEGRGEIGLHMDLSHLTTGQYRADLVAFQFDDQGNEDILDGVYPGLTFQIRKSLSAEEYLDWHTNYWGSIRLHDLFLED